MDRAENASGLKITAYKHVGIRVSDRAEALAFYGKLGFIEDAYFPDYPANEMVSNGGVRINLIFNGERRENGHNVLFDENCRYPGSRTRPSWSRISASSANCAGVRGSRSPKVQSKSMRGAARYLSATPTVTY